MKLGHTFAKGVMILCGKSGKMVEKDYTIQLHDMGLPI